MKTIFLNSLLVLLLSISACTKENYQTATVEKNCSGAFLNINNIEYHVCNSESISKFQEGSIIAVSFVKLKECNGSAKYETVCAYYAFNNNWIEVEKVK